MGIDKSQEKLLSMLKEIDDVCRANDITYFLDGGTALGAIRHNGIIPWDNDADIILTEENYNKLVEAVNRDTEKTGRTIQNGRINRDYQAVFGKYIDLTATKLVMTTPFWDENKANAGMSIDVFFLIPLPKDKKEKAYLMNLLYVYLELQLETRRYTGQSTERRVKTYKRAKLMCKLIGRERVLRSMEKKLFNRHYDDFDEYMYVTSPRKYPRVFPREMFDSEPMRLPFNGLELPVSKYVIEEMRLFYGENYWECPPEQEIIYHADMHSEKIPYKYFIRDFMRMLNPKEVKGKRMVFKDAFMNESFKRIQYVRNVCELEDGKTINDIRRTVAAKGLDLMNLVETRNYDTIDKLFGEFYRLQFSYDYKYQWHLMPLSEEEAYAALMSLVEYAEKPAKAGWYLTAYKLAINEELPPLLNRVQELLDAIFSIQCPYFYERWDDALAAAEKAVGIFPESRALAIEKIKCLAAASNAQNADEIAAQIKAFREKEPENMDLIKAEGDLNWNLGCREEAMKLYDSIYGKTYNGFFRLDIDKKKGGLTC